MSAFDEPMAGKGKTPLENAYLAFVDERRQAKVNWGDIPSFRDWVEAEYARLEQEAAALRAENVKLRLLADSTDTYWDEENQIDSPEDYADSAGLNMGDEFELTAAAYWKTKHRVTKIPDETSDDYDTEELSSQRGGEFPAYFKLKAEKEAAETELARYRAPVSDRVKKPVVYESEGGDIMDPECIPICDALNTLPGIETISSCCGHGYVPFRIYFIAWTLDHLKPILELIDESEIWTLRTSMATGNMEIYFVLDGKKLAYDEVNQLAALIAERGK